MSNMHLVENKRFNYWESCKGEKYGKEFLPKREEHAAHF